MNAFVVNDLKVNKNTVVDWYMFCREVCMLACVKESEKLGGVGEIDESLFGKMKYGKGRRVNGKWVFGGVQRESNKCFFRVVESRTKEELLKTGAHTNSIEGTWSAIKKGLHKAHVKGQFDSYLAEYMWRRSNGHELVDENFHKFLASIARVYPPTDHDEKQA
ncbi:putative transposase-like protein [Trichonephila clavipes]|nr:putative transposase-like protein [Trichonephila clavipes]